MNDTVSSRSALLGSIKTTFFGDSSIFLGLNWSLFQNSLGENAISEIVREENETKYENSR